MSNITARRNWRRALDDIKKARASGIYADVSDTSEERDARERVKSILLSTGGGAGPMKKRPLSAGDAVWCDWFYTFLSFILWVILWDPTLISTVFTA